MGAYGYGKPIRNIVSTDDSVIIEQGGDTVNLKVEKKVIEEINEDIINPQSLFLGSPFKTMNTSEGNLVDLAIYDESLNVVENIHRLSDRETHDISVEKNFQAVPNVYFSEFGGAEDNIRVPDLYNAIVSLHFYERESLLAKPIVNLEFTAVKNDFSETIELTSVAISEETIEYFGGSISFNLNLRFWTDPDKLFDPTLYHLKIGFNAKDYSKGFVQTEFDYLYIGQSGLAARQSLKHDNTLSTIRDTDNEIEKGLYVSQHFYNNYARPFTCIGEEMDASGGHHTLGIAKSDSSLEKISEMGVLDRGDEEFHEIKNGEMQVEFEFMAGTQELTEVPVAVDTGTLTTAYLMFEIEATKEEKQQLVNNEYLVNLQTRDYDSESETWGEWYDFWSEGTRHILDYNMGLAVYHQQSANYYTAFINGDLGAPSAWTQYMYRPMRVLVSTAPHHDNLPFVESIRGRVWLWFCDAKHKGGLQVRKSEKDGNALKEIPATSSDDVLRGLFVPGIEAKDASVSVEDYDIANKEVKLIKANVSTTPLNALKVLGDGLYCALTNSTYAAVWLLSPMPQTRQFTGIVMANGLRFVSCYADSITLDGSTEPTQILRINGYSGYVTHFPIMLISTEDNTIVTCRGVLDENGNMFLDTPSVTGTYVLTMQFFFYQFIS